MVRNMFVASLFDQSFYNNNNIYLLSKKMQVAARKITT